MTEPEEEPAAELQTRTYGAERAKAFTDAVIAIAITLLILPLMDSVGEVTETERPVLAWFAENFQTLGCFIVSFWIIALFWVWHHEVFSSVRVISESLLWTIVMWLLSIVWLPVATALLGLQGLAAAVYALSMAVTGFLYLRQLSYLRRHPDQHHVPTGVLRRSLASVAALVVVCLLTALVALVVPSIGGAALFVLFLTTPMAMWFNRIATARVASRADGSR